MKNRASTRIRGRFLRRGRVIRHKPYSVSSLLLMNQKPRRTRKRSPALYLWAFLVLLAGLSAFLLFRRETEPPAASLQAAKPVWKEGADWRPVPEILAGALAELDGAPCLEIKDGQGPPGTLHTSFDQEYQQRVQERLRGSMALGGVVAALDPRTGRILALASYNEAAEKPVAFFWKAYPAASVFKIVTAAAALETGCLEPESVMDYTGRNHTLYRRDLSQKTYTWSNRMTLEKAFAKSVNPVFGKIGIHALGRKTLQEYGSAFFFGLALPGEVPFETSRLQVPEDDLGIAEVASGFNRRTKVTPLHAAWMSALIASDGAAPVPWLVESVQAEDGEEVYRHREEIPVRVLSPKTARDMRALMEATIEAGTCQRSFRARSRDSRLRSVVFGGKTGNINNKTDTIKYDWFTGYARTESGEDPLALSVVMIHGRLLGHRANAIAYDLFRAYFRSRKE
jgi:cell division protein FtsI/penicillin-binding protein 2